MTSPDDDDAAGDPASASCLNCAAPLLGPFCAQCGQRHRPRLSLRDWLAEMSAAMADLDTVALRTLRELTIRPGTVAAEYVDGRRARYVSPLRYVLISGGVLLSVLALTKAANLGAPAMKTSIQFNNTLAAPVLALPAWAVFAGSGRSYTGQLVLQLYLRGHSLLLFSLLWVVAWLTGARPDGPLLYAGVGVGLLWQSAGLWQFHRDRVGGLLPRVIVGLLLTELASGGVLAATALMAGRAAS